nr:MFS transporter [Patulibacter sp. SYSU D01012]
MLACVLGSTIVTLDAFVVNVALTAIRDDLGGGLAGQQWTTNAYLLTLGSLLLVAGSIGDVLGERRVFVLGVALFGVTSVVCALAPTIELLVVGRALQGVAGALLTPAALAVIVAVFDEGERSRAIGTWTAWSGIGAAAGPVVGGWLIDVGSWHWVFLINVPLVLGTIAIVLRAVPAAGGGERTRRVDVVGALLCALGLGGVTFGLIQQPLSGWGSTAVLAPAAAGAALLVAFVGHERRAADPMLPLSLFRRRNFAWGNVETLLMYGGLALMSFYLTIFLQQVAGWDALAAGAATLPTTVVMLLLAGRFGGLADRLGPRRFMAAGPVVAGAGMLLLLRVDAAPDYVTEVLPAVLVFALGLSATVAPLTAAVLADADRDNAGAASGTNNAVARLAGLLAIAGVGVAVAASFGAAVDDGVAGRPLGPAARAAVADVRDAPLGRPDVAGLPAGDAATVRAAAQDASVHAFHVGIGVAGGLLLLGGLLGAVGIRDPERPSPAPGPLDGAAATR